MVNQAGLRANPVGFALPDHHSASSLGLFRRCPEKWRLKYALGLPDRPSTAGMMGSALHSAVEDLERGEITEDQLPGRAVALFRKWVVDTNDRVGADGIETYGKKLVDDCSRREVLLKEQIARYLEHRQRAGDTVSLVEESFTLRLPGVRKPVIGFIDQVRLDSSGRAFVFDLKSGSKKTEDATQLMVYGAACRALGIPVQYGVYWFGKDGSEYSFPLREEHNSLLAEEFRRLETAIRYGVFVAQPGDCYLCSYKPGCQWAAVPNKDK